MPRRPSRRVIAVLAALALAAVTLAVALPYAGARPQLLGHLAVRTAKGAPAYRTDKVLVRFKPQLGTAGARAALARHAATLGAAVGGTGFSTVATGGRSPADLVAALRLDPAVDAAELDYVRHADFTPNDQFYAQFQQDYLETMRFPEEWDLPQFGTGTITVAVVDTGVQASHPDLSGRVLAGHNSLNGGSNAADDNGHGTFVAGVIGANTNNSTGVAGAAFSKYGAWSPRILPVKVLDASGSGDDASVADGITWAADHGARVINLSLGGPGTSSVLQAAVNHAFSRDAVVVAAAGNDSTSTPSYPAAFPGVLSVSATGHDGTFAWFSNFGSWVQVAAPGVSIISSYPFFDPPYAIGDGTSFSSPLVAAVAASVREQNPSMTQDQVVSQIETTAHDVGAPGTDQYYGHGVVDANAALGGTAQAPSTIAPDGNDTSGTATSFTSSTSGTIAPEGDVDWYQTGLTPGLWRVTVTPPAYSTQDTRAAEMDAAVDVFDAGLHRVEAAVGTDPDHGSSGAATLVVAVPSAGSYFVEVHNHLPAQSPGSYTLSATQVNPVGRVTPLPTARVFDTVTGVGGVRGRLAGGHAVNVPVLGHGGVPASGVSAVAVNLTAYAPTNARGALIAYPAGSGRPALGMVPFLASQNASSTQVVRVGSGGAISVYNTSGAAYVLVDVTGYVDDSGTAVVPLRATRAIDTVHGIGVRAGKVAAGTTVSGIILGHFGVPSSGVSAVVLNLAASQPTTSGALVAYPYGSAAPHSGTVYYPGRDTATLAVVKIGSRGAVTVLNTRGATHVLADVVGYVPTSGAVAGHLAPFATARVLDTTIGLGAPRAKVGPKKSIVLKVLGQAGVPTTGIRAVLLNVVASGSTAPSSLDAWPNGNSPPATRMVYFGTGQTVSNLVLVNVGSAGSVVLYNSAGSVNIQASVEGVVLSG